MFTWTNPYLAKIDSFPGFLLIGEKNSPTKDELSHITKLASSFKFIFLEPCSGSGGHLIELAKANPDALCIGIEQRYKRAFRTVEKALGFGLKNLICFRGDVKEFIKALPENFTDRVYLNFPDPWERSKWEKHRIISKGFSDSVSRILKPSGKFKFKTDHHNSFKSACDLFSNDLRFKIINQNLDLPPEESEHMSEFEMLFRTKKMPVYFLECGLMGV